MTYLRSRYKEAGISPYHTASNHRGMFEVTNNGLSRQFKNASGWAKKDKWKLKDFEEIRKRLLERHKNEVRKDYLITFLKGG